MNSQELPTNVCDRKPPEEEEEGEGSEGEEGGPGTPWKIIFLCLPPLSGGHWEKEKGEPY